MATLDGNAVAGAGGAIGGSGKIFSNTKDGNVAAAGVSARLRYQKRARDLSGPGPLPAYVFWMTDDPSAVYPNAPPFGGPLVEETIIKVFQQ
jgi:hypothetical protein